MRLLNSDFLNTIKASQLGCPLRGANHHLGGLEERKSYTLLHQGYNKTKCY